MIDTQVVGHGLLEALHLWAQHIAVAADHLDHPGLQGAAQGLVPALEIDEGNAVGHQRSRIISPIIDAVRNASSATRPLTGVGRLPATAARKASHSSRRASPAVKRLCSMRTSSGLLTTPGRLAV